MSLIRARRDYRAMSERELLKQPLSVIEAALAEEQAAWRALRDRVEALRARYEALARERATAATLRKIEIDAEMKDLRDEGAVLWNRLSDAHVEWHRQTWLRDRAAHLRTVIRVARANRARLERPLELGVTMREYNEAKRWTNEILKTYDK